MKPVYYEEEVFPKVFECQHGQRSRSQWLIGCKAKAKRLEIVVEDTHTRARPRSRTNYVFASRWTVCVWHQPTVFTKKNILKTNYWSNSWTDRMQYHFYNYRRDECLNTRDERLTIICFFCFLFALACQQKSVVVNYLACRSRYTHNIER